MDENKRRNNLNEASQQESDDWDDGLYGWDEDTNDIMSLINSCNDDKPEPTPEERAAFEQRKQEAKERYEAQLKAFESLRNTICSPGWMEWLDGLYDDALHIHRQGDAKQGLEYLVKKIMEHKYNDYDKIDKYFAEHPEEKKAFYHQPTSYKEEAILGDQIDSVYW